MYIAPYHFQQRRTFFGIDKNVENILELIDKNVENILELCFVQELPSTAKYKRSLSCAIDR